MKQVKAFQVESRLGPMFGALSEKGLMALTIPAKGEKEFLQKLARFKAEPRWVKPQGQLAGRWLLAYLKGKNPAMDMALDLDGLSDFTRSVVTALLEIPYGQTTTYGQIAAQLGRPLAARAVGRAVGSNPVPIFAPCHRVVGKNGSLTGFGSGLDTKRALLALEMEGLPLV